MKKIMTEFRSKILEKLQENKTKTNGHCGLYITDFNMNVKELKQELNKLYVEGKIIVRKGINGKLIMLK